MNDEFTSDVRKLFDQISNCNAFTVALDTFMMRCVSMRYANSDDLLSGQGAALYGVRWNPPGILAVYGSLDVVTATKESYAALREFGFQPRDVRPRVTVGATIRLQSLLDLTSARTRRRIGFSVAELMDEDWHAIQDGGEWSWTQAIGVGCREAGFEGLIAPSAQGRWRGKNVVYFPDRLHTGSQTTLLHPEDLPPPRRR
ncbi:MAG: RES family NAD+ phosphorylase [Pirellulales bacterium]